MTGLERKIELMKKGVTISSIARDLKLSFGHVQKVVAGERRSPNVERAIATAIGRPVTRVFPPSAA